MARNRSDPDRLALWQRARAGDREALRQLWAKEKIRRIGDINLVAMFGEPLTSNFCEKTLEASKVEGEHDTQKITEEKPVLRAVPEAW